MELGRMERPSKHAFVVNGVSVDLAAERLRSRGAGRRSQAAILRGSAPSCRERRPDRAQGRADAGGLARHRGHGRQPGAVHPRCPPRPARPEPGGAAQRAAAGLSAGSAAARGAVLGPRRAGCRGPAGGAGVGRGLVVAHGPGSRTTALDRRAAVRRHERGRQPAATWATALRTTSSRCWHARRTCW